jgi:hypothetical protein
LFAFCGIVIAVFIVSGLMAGLLLLPLFMFDSPYGYFGRCMQLVRIITRTEDKWNKRQLDKKIKKWNNDRTTKT